ncbi:MAG TPA: tetratricopeptide repeat protein [Paracoccus sp. (in: a-proteobacteria)]|uniref:tetratricopeptide repeat protein n=1 Tax=uncultured Paracoccus sp. TaxID=189685 RepID=UPI00261B3407|nr:tetratricopeptide repeat protein [uncultured Paracoccus sp.]HMQ40800.1 tetratricopeptide repeat protein [Paracoccus sp. (in: a-proteobacteria)]HMR35515.1 tetratricopeptide repeat protein [Paracoccus sp. (in: a-proteobacteria)]
MKLIPSLALACLISLPAIGPGHAQDDTPPPPRPDQLGTEGAAAPLTRDLAGPYLAARTAVIENEFAIAADYFLRALKQDPGSAYLSDSALIALLSAGQIDRAVALADERPMSGPVSSRLVELVERAKAAQSQDWTVLLAQLDTKVSRDDGSEQLLDGMLRAWALLGEGKAADADAAFNRVRQIGGADGLVDYHLALAKALVGDFEAAAKLLHSDTPEGNVLAAVAEAQVLAQLDRREDALTVLEKVEGIGIDGVADELARKLAAGEPVEFDLVKDPRDGIAQVFLTFATLLANDIDPNPLALIHARVASYISPDMADARLMVAQMLQSMGQFEEAEAEFDKLREQGQLRPTAELLRIDALARADRMGDAEKAALALTAARSDLPQGWIALGDLLRQQEKWAQAVPAYDKALALIDEGDPDERWFPLYARAIALERQSLFDRAEADLKAALEIRPDNAQLLNYLGYSYVDRGQNMDEALRLIERAVELSPDDGYILDSLGWVLYRLGRYDEAVAPQERAIAAMASDPLVNDHLGDIYWMVGRKREAEIQWKRALSFNPETEAEETRIRAKLDRGLDAVLADEAANGGTLPEPVDAPAEPEQPVE